MSQKPSFFPFQGGLNQTTQAIAVPKGHAIAVLNHESVSQGYARVGGYERFDGHPSPTTAGAVEDDPTAKAALIAAARALIAVVPGEGDVRGVWSFNGIRYAWRDNVGATACVMYKESAAGWVAVDIGKSLAFTSGGVTEIVAGNTVTGATSGATAVVRRVILESGTWAAGTAAGRMIVNTPVGVFVAENLNVGAAPNLATIAAAPAAQTFPAGGRYFFINHNFYGAANLRRAYGVNGVGKAFEFDGTSVVFISTGMVDDKPNRIAHFKQCLFLAFPGGSVQYSDVGEPLVWNPILGAGEIGMGDEVTDFISNNLNALTILSASSIASLIGTDPTDWALEPMTEEAGAVPFTAQRVGVALYLDNRGLRSITATQAYGNFRLGTLTEQIQKTLDLKRKGGVLPTASCVVRTKNQYRMFYDDGSGVSMFFGRKYPEPMLFDLGLPVTCICTVDEPGASERIFFGSDNGFVYEMDVGASFDGEAIGAYIQLAYNHEGGPTILKRWHKSILELEAKPGTEIGMTGSFDYGGGEQGSLPVSLFDVVASGGGLWNIASWNDFAWSTALAGKAECGIDGQGFNMSPIIVSDSAVQDGYILQGMTNLFSVRGQGR